MTPSSNESSSSSSALQPKSSNLTKKKISSKQAASKIQAGHGKNEGVDPNWAYKPPAGVSLLENPEGGGEFDWDTIENDDDLELWLIRVPDSIKPKYLEKMEIELGPASKTLRTGTLNRKYTSFDIWSLGDDDDQDKGGEEIKGISCLLPRKSKKGKLYTAPRPIARHLVLSAQPVIPSVDPSASSTEGPYKGPPRECYPTEVLKHQFLPYGSLSAVEQDDPSEMEMDVDIPKAVSSLPSPTQKKAKPSPSKVEAKKVKGKKRKGDEDAPAGKKTKKAKTS